MLIKKEQSGKRYYAYHLKHRLTGEIIELGSSAILSEEDCIKHNITETWANDWEFGFREVKDQPLPIHGTPLKPEVR